MIERGCVNSKTDTASSVFYFRMSHAEEDFVAIQEVEDEEEDGDVAELDEEAVVVANVLLQPEEEGAADALEADDVADDVGGDAVHAIDFQERQVTVVAAAVYPIVEQAHEQETVAAADEHHGACPDVFDNGVYQVPRPAEGNHCRTDGCQEECLAPRLHRALQCLACKHTREHGDDEVDAAEYPGVGVGGVDDDRTVDDLGGVAEASENGHIDALGEIAMGRVVAAAEAVEGDELHGCPECQEQAHGDADLCLPAGVEIDDGAEEIAYGYGLKGIGEEVDTVRVEGQQVALYHHAEEP